MAFYEEVSSGPSGGVPLAMLRWWVKQVRQRSLCKAAGQGGKPTWLRPCPGCIHISLAM